MLHLSPVHLNDEFNYALDRLEHSREHFFVTGRAGTGKSTLLGLFRDTTKKRCAFLAPTGVAALHIRGQTIHSFFKFPPKMISRDDIKKRKNHRLYKKVACIVIDEISMVRADMMDAIDIFLKKNRENPEPFGGVQMIFFGDLFQLPPVIANAFERQYLQTHYESPYFFSAHLFSHLTERIETIELHMVFRQSDRNFVNILDRIRTRTFDQEDLDELNQRVIKDQVADEHFITLATRNNTVYKINTKKLEELNGPEYEYSGKIQGKFDIKNPPAPLQLRLRKGAQVMFVRNDVDKKFVNGTLGTIAHLESSEIKVEIINEENKSDELISVAREVWEIINYKYNEKNPDKIETEVVGTFEQYPLQLAWAVTIHKSQGKTFDNVLIDMASGAFDYGQMYVALSRCTSLDGIYLKKAVRPDDILVDERIVEFYQAWR